MKKKVLFVIAKMSIGGSQKSLVNALSQIDYDKYDVSLYVRENRTDLIGDVPESVRVCVNTNPERYNRNFYSVFGEFLDVSRISKVLKRFRKMISRKEADFVDGKKSLYEKANYSMLSEKYDIAISYLQGYVCKFTWDYTNADRKICFYHNSTDATPVLHSEYLRKYEKIVAVSDGVKDFISEKYPDISNKLTVIQNLINIESIKLKALELPEAVSRKNGETVLCSCGRISHEKGYDLALDAAEILCKNGMDFIWYFVGDGPDRGKIEGMIKEKQLSENIVVTGFQNNPYPYIAGCDIYVQPSYEESQSLTTVEAMILNNVVVSTDTVGGKMNIETEKNGILTEISGEGIADGIMKLIRDRELFVKIRNNVDKLDYGISNKIITEQWEKLLEGDCRE